MPVVKNKSNSGKGFRDQRGISDQTGQSQEIGRLGF